MTTNDWERGYILQADDTYFFGQGPARDDQAQEPVPHEDIYHGYHPAHHAPQAGGYGRHEPVMTRQGAGYGQAPQPGYAQPRAPQHAQPVYAQPAPQGYHQPQHQAAPGYGDWNAAPRQPQYQPEPEPDAGWTDHGYGGAPEYDQEPARGFGGRFSRYAQMTGGIMSLALIAGLGVWGYQLAMRDVTGIPVVQALQGPMRIQPEDPGGQAADHMGLAVNNVAAVGSASGPADQVTLAPSSGRLADEDVPADPSSVLMAESAPAPLTAEPGADGDDPVAAALAMVEEMTDGVAPLDPAMPTEDSVASAEAEASPEVDADMIAASATAAVNAALQGAVADAADIPAPTNAVATVPASVPGVSVSPRPVARPFALETLALAKAEEAAARGADEIAPTEVPVGTRLVQLGAFDSEEVARSEWSRLAGSFAEYMSGKTRVIERAQSGGQTFYRLRAMGFTDLADARRFCSALMAGQAACIPVVTR